MRAGVIGLGEIGGGIARNLARSGVETHVADLAQEAIDACTEAGAKAVSSPRELGANCDVIGVVVRDDDQTRSVMLGDEGILAGSTPGTIVLLHSTIFPDTVSEMAEAALPFEVEVIDAALTGSAAKAEAGELTFMAGGTAEQIERVRPYLEPAAKRIVHTGELTTGTATKLCVNLMGYIQFLSGYEANLLATNAGVDLDRFDDVTRSNGALTPNVEAYLALARGDTSAEGTQQYLSGITDLAEKDLSLALAYAKRLGITLPGGALTQQLMARVYGLNDPNKR